MAASSSQVFQQIILDGIQTFEGKGCIFELRYNEPVQDPILSVFIDVKVVHSVFYVGVLCSTMNQARKIRDNSNIELCTLATIAKRVDGEGIMALFECIGIASVINTMENLNDHTLKLSEEDIRKIRFSIYDLMSGEELACYLSEASQDNSDLEMNQNNGDLLQYICSRADRSSVDDSEIDARLQDLEARRSILMDEIGNVEKEINALLSARHPQTPTVTTSGVKTLFSNNNAPATEQPSSEFAFQP